MKMTTCLAAFLLLGCLASPVLAEEPAAKGCCSEMKTLAAAKIPDAAAAARAAELERLLAVMNESIGQEKLDAMSAILNRLVEQDKALRQFPASPSSSGTAAKP